MSYAYSLHPASRLQPVPPPFVVRIIGPSGAGKTALVAALCRALRQRWRVAAAAPRKDAVALRRDSALDPAWIAPLDEGGLESLLDARPEVLLLEAGGPAGACSKLVADAVVAVVPIALSDETRADPTIMGATVLIVNKLDLAAAQGIAPDALARELRSRRGEAPFFMVQCRATLGLTPVIEWFSRAYSTQSMSVGGSVR